jgi:hypothetical protein
MDLEHGVLAVLRLGPSLREVVVVRDRDLHATHMGCCGIGQVDRVPETKIELAAGAVEIGRLAVPFETTRIEPVILP